MQEFYSFRYAMARTAPIIIIPRAVPLAFLVMTSRTHYFRHVTVVEKFSLSATARKVISFVSALKQQKVT